MEIKEIAVEARSETGSNGSRRLRRAGKVPAVIYSEGKPAQTLELDAHAFVLAVRGCQQSQLFKLKSSQSELDGQLAMVKSVQSDPRRGDLQHVDLFLIHEGHRVHVKVQVELTGQSAAVKESRGMLNQTIYEIELECLPRNIPDRIKVDISGLDEGDTLHASDLPLPKDTVLKSSPGLSIVSVLSAQAETAAAGGAAA